MDDVPSYSSDGFLLEEINGPHTDTHRLHTGVEISEGGINH